MKIHGHPQLTDYKADGSDWPIIDCQGWFGDPDPLMAGHVHIVPKCPLYGEITTSTLEVPFTIKAHMFSGIISIFNGPQIKSVKWDETGTDQMPIMKGDPNGLKEWTGTALFDFSLGDDDFLHIFRFPKHGWYGLRFFSRTSLDNGDAVDVIATPAVYSMLDPTAPEQKPPEQGNPGVLIRTSVTIWRPNEGGIVGEMITEIDDYIPLLPINKPWPTIGNMYNYTAPVSTEQTERFELRLDPDLHHGVRGSLQRSVDIGPGQNRSFFGPFVIDPTAMGTGGHKEMVVWTQPFKTESFSSVIVFPVLVGDGVPPPIRVTVPNIVNKSQMQASAELIAAGLLVGTIMEMGDQSIAKGNVISQFPNAGSLVVPGSTVNLMISSGAVIVPNEVWVPRVPTFMQLEINGIPQKRWQICGVDNSDTMDDCIEIMTKPE